MLIDLLIAIAGLACLFFGGEGLVRGAARIATKWGVPPLVIGLTVVALGTSMPELVVSVRAALQGNSDISLGNVIGSNIANIGLILGLTGLFFPIAIHANLIQREVPIMLGVAVLAYVFALDETVGRVDGFILAGGYVVFTGALYWMAQRSTADADDIIEEVEDLEGDTPIRIPVEFGRLAFGIAILLVGAELTLNGAIGLARNLGISEVVIGITLVSVGTSLPELATAFVAALRAHTDIAAGNIIGSNIANTLLILGVTASLQPIDVADELLNFEFPVMMGFTLLIVPIAVRKDLPRLGAGILLASYVIFTITLFVF